MNGFNLFCKKIYMGVVTTTPEFESRSFIYSQKERGKPIANKNETIYINTKTKSIKAHNNKQIN